MTNLYKGQEATAGTGDGNTNWLQVSKEVKQRVFSLLNFLFLSLIFVFILRQAGLKVECGFKLEEEMS